MLGGTGVSCPVGVAKPGEYRLNRRVAAAIEARAGGRQVYLEHGRTAGLSASGTF